MRWLTSGVFMPCNHPLNNSQVINSRCNDKYIRRRRLCKCGVKYNTYEFMLDTSAGAPRCGIPSWLSSLSTKVEGWYEIYRQRHSEKLQAKTDRREQIMHRFRGQ